MMQKVLIVEDNVVASQTIASKLREYQYDVVCVHDGQKAIDAFNKTHFDVVLLDLLLPMVSGEEILKYIRERSDTPIIIMSAKDNDIEKAINLELGADDYLAKPFSMIELIARIKAVIRRSTRSEHKTRATFLILDDIKIDFNKFIATKNDKNLELTYKEFEILKLLASDPEATFSKQMIYRKVWNEEYFDNDNVINVHIRRLREKIETDPSSPKIVLTVWGFGYKIGVPINERTNE
jgi:two-component system, OmpR family, response regulator VicR